MGVQYELSVTSITGAIDHYGYKKDGETGPVVHGRNDMQSPRLRVNPHKLQEVIDTIMADTARLQWNTNPNGKVAITFEKVELDD